MFRLGLVIPATVCALLGIVASSPAEPPPDYVLEEEIRPDGIHVLDGSYVLDDGEFQVNVTNHGLIGSQFSAALPYSHAPSGQWPGGSGHEYLWGAGLWVGARVGGDIAVTTGQYDRELRPDDDLRATIYEGVEGRITRPAPEEWITGRRYPDGRGDDDRDNRVDEDLLNGYDDDRDGQVDEDWGQLGTQMFTCTMRDDLPLIQEIYPAHRPLGITVVQKAFTWFQDDFDDIVGLDFEVRNTGTEVLTDVYLGFFVDGDIQRRQENRSDPDDLAGFYQGSRRGSDDTFYDLQVGWMKDAAPVDPLPGVMGVVLLDHPTDFRRESDGPNRVGIRSFQIFATNTQVIQDGLPLSDQDRYYVMARNEIDRDTRPDKAGDLKFLMSCGPFSYLPPGRTLNLRLAMVMGYGFEDMLDNALLAAEIGRGTWMDLDQSSATGVSQRESLVCLGDYPANPDGSDPLFGYKIVMMDETCVGSGSFMFVDVIRKDIMEPQPDGRTCIWVNADNCEECFRRHGIPCTEANGLYWVATNLPWWYPPPPYYTGTRGREHHVGWIHETELPPSPPNIRLVPGNHQVEIYWDDGPEYETDFFRGVVDFESYRVWRVDGWVRPSGTSELLGPPADMWGMIAEFDLINEIPAFLNYNDVALPLGRNTGLEGATYVPDCLGDPRFAGLAAVMQEFVVADRTGSHLVMPVLRDRDGNPVPGLQQFLPWEFWPTVLDTFFAVTPRAGNAALGVTAKHGTRYYHYVDTEVHNGFSVFYAVTAADHLLEEEGGLYYPAGYGIQSEPGNNFSLTVPGEPAQTPAERRSEGPNIYVYPNPATNESLAEFQAQPPDHDDPVGQRIMFANLPAALNTIKVYTASGDHVVTLVHDGRTEGGARSWNLLSRNGQEIGSGIYLYVVQSEGGQFEDFFGRFVVVR